MPQPLPFSLTRWIPAAENKNPAPNSNARILWGGWCLSPLWSGTGESFINPRNKPALCSQPFSLQDALLAETMSLGLSIPLCFSIPWHFICSSTSCTHLTHISWVLQYARCCWRCWYKLLWTRQSPCLYEASTRKIEKRNNVRGGMCCYISLSRMSKSVRVEGCTYCNPKIELFTRHNPNTMITLTNTRTRIS